MLFVLHGGEPLPVITGALRCCRQETPRGYKYEACHCCDYSELSSTTLHCLLLDGALLCFCARVRVSYRTRQSSLTRPRREREAKPGNPSGGVKKRKGQKRSELRRKGGRGRAWRACLCSAALTGGNSKGSLHGDLLSQHGVCSVYSVRRI